VSAAHATAVRPVRWVWRRHAALMAVSLLIMIAAPYLGSLPVRTIPVVVALASGHPAPGGELSLFLGDRAGDLGAVLAVLVVAGGLSLALALVQTRVAARLSSQANRDLAGELHRVLLDRPPAFLRQPGRADMIRTALIQQTRVVSSYATNTLPSAIGILFAVVIWAQTLYSAVSAPGQEAAAAAVVLGVVVLLLAANLIAVWVAGKRSQTAQRDVMKQQGAFIGLAGESLGSIASLQLNVAADEQQRRVAAVLAEMSRAEVRVANWSGLATAVGGGVVMLGIPLLVVAWQGLGLAGESLAVMIPALLMLQRAISSVGSLWTTRKVSLPAVELVGEMMAAAPSVRDRDGDARPAEIRGRLAFDQVTWGVDGRAILKGVSFTVEPGETVAIVGAGGGGKSSLLRLALRLDAATGGSITLDGTEVTDIALDELRKRIGILEQHPAFFARSLRDNLLLDGRAIADERIREVARTCHIDELVERVGLANPLPDGGRTLSGSERRRLGLVRLLLREPDVIFVDELEAGLPQALAQSLYRDLRAATAGKTCLMVTHRPDLLAADRVAFVHEGTILDVGAHQELEQRSAPYRSLLAEKREGEPA